MEARSNSEDQEYRFEEGTFGHLVESYNPARLHVYCEKNKSTADNIRASFALHKEDLLGLCVKPDVNISPEQGNVIKGFMGEVFDFEANKRISVGDDLMKVDNEKLLVLATYINSLQK